MEKQSLQTRADCQRTRGNAPERIHERLWLT
jgi:hypothetical protein